MIVNLYSSLKLALVVLHFKAITQALPEQNKNSVGDPVIPIMSVKIQWNFTHVDGKVNSSPCMMMVFSNGSGMGNRAVTERNIKNLVTLGHLFLGLCLHELGWRHRPPTSWIRCCNGPLRLLDPLIQFLVTSQSSLIFVMVLS